MKTYQSISRSSAKRYAKPEPVSSVLDSALKHYRISGKVKQYTVFKCWPEIVGSELARVARPEKITRGRVLVVKVMDAAWAQEITLRKAEIITKFQQLSAGAVIEDIRFIISSPRDFPN